MNVVTVCNLLRPPSTLIHHLKKDITYSVAFAYQVRSNKELHCLELVKKGNYQRKGKEMSGEGELAARKDDDATSDKRPQFGNRYLSNPDNVFQHNAWDNVAWDPEQLEAAKKKVNENSTELVEQDKRDSYETEADEYWNKFYSQHQNKFFKDRHWLFTEFPELSSDNVQTPGKEIINEDEVKTSIDATQKDGLFEETPGANSSQQDNVSRETLDTDLICTQQGGMLKEMSGAETSATNSIPMVDAKTPANEKETGGIDVNSQESKNHKAVPRTNPVGRNESAGSCDIDFPGKSAAKRILEVGCGVGNTIFPILQTNADPRLFVYGCDFSSVAVDIVRQHAEYDPSRCHAFVCDISDTSATFPFPESSLDVVVVIFVLSAINPDRFLTTIQTLSKLLKPGGRILFRDYGRYDMAQLRFKKGRCLSDNFYVRGDGTRVYFFTQDELRTLFTAAGLIEEQNIIDRRLQVNRGRQLTMYRVWIQCKYRKP